MAAADVSSPTLWDSLAFVVLAGLVAPFSSSSVRGDASSVFAPRATAEETPEEAQRRAEVLQRRGLDMVALNRLARADHEAYLEELVKLQVMFAADDETCTAHVSDDGAADDVIALLKPVDNLVELEVYASHLAPESMTTLISFPKLERLRLAHLPLTDKIVDRISRLTTLKSLALDDPANKLSDDALHSLTRLTALEELNLFYLSSEVSKGGFADLASLPALRKLNIAGHSITDEALRELARSKSLTDFSMHLWMASDEELGAFSADGWRWLASLPNLESLEIDHDYVSAESIRHLQAARRLTRLVLRECSGLDDQVLTAIGELANLRALSLEVSTVTDDSLTPLNRLAHLEELLLDSDQLSNAGLKSLGELKELKKLAIRGKGVTNEAFSYVRRYSKLEHLEVGANRHLDEPLISNEGLKAIGHAPHLLTIHLAHAGITREGLEMLNGLPKLRWVSVSVSPGPNDTYLWQPASRRSLAERRRADPEGAANVDRFIAELAAIGVKCNEFHPAEWQIDAHGPQVTDEVIARLDGPLRIIGLGVGPAKVTSACFDSIAKLSDLQHLGLEKLELSPAAIEKLASLPKLRGIGLMGCSIADGALEPLKKSESLQMLTISGGPRQITAKQMDAIVSIPSLYQLFIDGNAPDAEALRPLSRSKSLHRLIFQGFDVPDEVFGIVAAMRHLNDLSLGGSKITAAGLRQLKSARHLEFLALNECPQLGDDALAALGEVKNLWDLSVAGNSITDAGLTHLQGLAKLQHLDLGDTQVTRAGLEKFVKPPQLLRISARHTDGDDDFEWERPEPAMR